MAQILKDASGASIRSGEKPVLSTQSLYEFKKVDLEKRVLTIIGTDETFDRDGDQLLCTKKSWMLDNYYKNPVFLWVHNYCSIPIGRSEKLQIKKDPNKMVFTIKFPPQGLFPQADLILALYSLGIINASSVGFIPWKWEQLSAEDVPKEGPPNEIFWSRNRFLEQELLELSGCPVPSNPSATIIEEAFSLSGLPKALGSRVIKELRSSAPIQPKNSDDVLEELSLTKFEIVEEKDGISIFIPSPNTKSDDDTILAKENEDELSLQKEEIVSDLSEEKDSVEGVLLEAEDSSKEILSAIKELSGTVEKTFSEISKSIIDLKLSVVSISVAIQDFSKQTSKRTILGEILSEKTLSGTEELSEKNPKEEEEWLGVKNTIGSMRNILRES